MKRHDSDRVHDVRRVRGSPAGKNIDFSPANEHALVGKLSRPLQLGVLVHGVDAAHRACTGTARKEVSPIAEVADASWHCREALEGRSETALSGGAIIAKREIGAAGKKGFPAVDPVKPAGAAAHEALSTMARRDEARPDRPSAAA